MNEIAFVITVPLVCGALVTSPFWAPLAFDFAEKWLTVSGRQKREVQKLFDIKIDMVCALLREGQGWHFERYRAEHPSIGVSMWVANGRFGLGVRFDGKQCNPHDGGLTRSQKRRIWTAYQGRGEDAKAAALQLEEFMARVSRHREDAA